VFASISFGDWVRAVSTPIILSWRLQISLEAAARALLEPGDGPHADFSRPTGEAALTRCRGTYSRPCDKSFFRYCKGDTANSKTGSTIYVGAPIGTAQALAVLLNGSVPPINE